MKHGKKYVDAAKLVDRTKLYETDEALDTVIKTATAKFDETVELHVKLGVTLTSRSEALSYFPTVPARRYAFWLSAKAPTRSLQRKPALIMSALRT